MLIDVHVLCLSQTNIHQFLFAFVSITLKAAFKNTSIENVHFGDNFKMWDKIQNLSATKLTFGLFYIFEKNFIVL